MSAPYAETRYGFNYGALTIERLISHKGMVVIVIKCGTHQLEVQASPTGRRRYVTVVGDWNVHRKPR